MGHNELLPLFFESVRCMVSFHVATLLSEFPVSNIVRHVGGQALNIKVRTDPLAFDASVLYSDALEGSEKQR